MEKTTTPDFRALCAGLAAELQGLSMARATEAAGAVGRQGEEQVLEGLLHRAAGADPEERPALKAALAALANGDTLLAEASFEQEVEASLAVVRGDLAWAALKETETK